MPCAVQVSWIQFQGKVVMTTGESETVRYSDVDLGYLDSVREQIPVSKQKRHDVYQLVDKGSHWIWLYGNIVVVVWSMQCIVVLCRYPAGLCFSPVICCLATKIFILNRLSWWGVSKLLTNVTIFDYTIHILSILLIKQLCFHKVPHYVQNIWDEYIVSFVMGLVHDLSSSRKSGYDSSCISSYLK